MALSERHLDGLLSDTTSALGLMASLSESFKTVESETTSFQAQCEDLLDEQKRLRSLADEVGTDLQYYAYLEPLTRRLNAPGASRSVRSDDFLDMLLNLNTCIDFMDQHVSFWPMSSISSVEFSGCCPNKSCNLKFEWKWKLQVANVHSPTIETQASTKLDTLLCWTKLST